jgi:predicted nucleic acid-binding protein
MTRFVIDAPVAVHLATVGADIPAAHRLVAPTLLRSQALALVYGAVRRGDTEPKAARAVLDGIRGLNIRLLGDRSMQDNAWKIAESFGWPDTYRAEYIALTRLQADALVTFDAEFAAAAGTLVGIASPDAVLRP